MTLEILITIITILLIHWIADFVLQTDWQAKNKSINNMALLSHTFVYSMVIFMASFLYFVAGDIFKAFLFFIITFVCHTITDYFTSRWVRKLFGKQDFHNGFIVIGIDQILHYIQLFLTFYLLT